MSKLFKRHEFVLIIDDDKNNLEVLGDMVGYWQVNIVTARSGNEALTRLQEMDPKPVIIISDISMPGMDGFTLLPKLRETNPATHIPVIALTALAMPGDEERVMTSGFDGYVSKPINMDELEETLTRVRRIQRQRDQPSVQDDQTPIPNNDKSPEEVKSQEQAS